MWWRLQGRLIDHLRNTQLIGLEDLQALVLDEADRLLSMGFMDEVRAGTRCGSGPSSAAASRARVGVLQPAAPCAAWAGSVCGAARLLAHLQQLYRCGAQVQHIVGMAPRDRQTMLFSATMTEDVERLVRVSLRRPVRLAADTRDTAPAQLVQEIVRLKVRRPRCPGFRVRRPQCAASGAAQLRLVLCVEA